MPPQILLRYGFFTAAALLLAAAPLAHATTYTFTGNTTGNTTWSSGTNWDTAPVSGSTTDLVFGTGQALASGADVITTQDIASPPFLLNSLTTNYTSDGPTEPSVKIQTGALNFVSDGLTTPTIALNSTGAVPPQFVFMSAVNFANDIAISGASSVRFEGVITNTDGAVVTKSGGGTLRIASNNAGYTGNFNVTGGILQIGNNGNVGDAGSGTVTLSTGGSFIVRRSSGTLALNNTITGTGNVRFQTRGNFVATINKANDYIGATLLEPSSTTLVSNGGIKLGVDDGLSTTTAFTISASTGNSSIQTFNLNGFNQTLGSIATGTGGNTTNSIITNSGAGLKTLTISNSSGSTTYAGLISGNISLTKSGASTQVLTGNNTYTGNTTVTGGNLTVSTGGNLTGTANVVVTGGSLLIGANEVIKDTAGVTLGGGTLAMSGAYTETLGALTLSASSTLDFGSLASQFKFSSFTPGTFTLNVARWTSSDHLVFSADQEAAGNLSKFNFGSGLTAAQQPFSGGGFEIVAIPEPGTIVTGVLLLGSLVLIECRRLRRMVRLGGCSKISPGADGLC